MDFRLMNDFRYVATLTIELLFQIHECAVDVILKKHKNVGDLLSAQHANQKLINQAYLAKILQKNIVFLARQELPMRGNWVDDDTFGGCEWDSIFNNYCFYELKMTLLFLTS